MNKYLYATVLLLSSCTSDFLDVKPRSNIVVPSSLENLEQLLNNQILYQTGALPFLSSDEYEFIDDDAWRSTNTTTERNAYIWATDLFDGEQSVRDWNEPYQSIFYANSVLGRLGNVDSSGAPTLYRRIKGQALFLRSYAFASLAFGFAPAYDANNAHAQLGIPLRLFPEIDEVVQRATLYDTYERIIADCRESASLLPEQLQSSNPFYATKAAAYALLARVYLSMGKYTEALQNADSCLTRYPTLIDLNDVDVTSSTPFPETQYTEILFATQQSPAYATTVLSTRNSAIRVAPGLYGLYEETDLRRRLLFAEGDDGIVRFKRGFNTGNYAFTGLATDEVYLIKAECEVRVGNVELGMEYLHRLRIHRYETEAGPSKPNPKDSDQALEWIIDERRRELATRGLRWVDLKRLSQEGRGIEVSRSVNDRVHTLSPNDPRYVFPIPFDEITRSQIQQNQR